jgi:hypothetical protein
VTGDPDRERYVQYRQTEAGSSGPPYCFGASVGDTPPMLWDFLLPT